MCWSDKAFNLKVTFKINSFPTKSMTSDKHIDASDDLCDQSEHSNTNSW